MIKGKIFLLSCRGGDGEVANNLAWALAKKNNAKVVACTVGVSYNDFMWLGYQARVGKDWFFKTGTFWYEYSYVNGQARKVPWSPKWLTLTPFLGI